MKFNIFIINTLLNFVDKIKVGRFQYGFSKELLNFTNYMLMNFLIDWSQEEKETKKRNARKLVSNSQEFVRYLT